MKSWYREIIDIEKSFLDIEKSILDIFLISKIPFPILFLLKNAEFLISRIQFLYKLFLSFYQNYFIVYVLLQIFRIIFPKKTVPLHFMYCQSTMV